MKEIPDKNIFMMCEELNLDALREIPKGFHIRNCLESELDFWKAMHFDDPETAASYRQYMDEFFSNVYGSKRDLFFQKCLFICDAADEIIGSCFDWKAYDKITTLHWFKVLKKYEGRGIGRALLSYIMRNIPEQEYPVFLHTQPGSFRAIKLYSDFGFALLSGSNIGHRSNDLEECLPILKEIMPCQSYQKLRIVKTPNYLFEAASSSNISEF